MSDNPSVNPPVVIRASTTAPLPQILPPLAKDEKAVSVMLYTHQMLWWGTIIMKEAVRVHMWLRTSAAPEIIHIYNARMLFQGSIEKHKPVAIKDGHIFTNDILAYHLLPPEKEPLDYDPNEPNRHLEAIAAFAGSFRFDGNVLMSNLYNIGRYVETTHERFVSIYDVEVTYPFSGSQAPLKVPQALVKIATAAFASK
jgi:hypothetical protein